MFPADAYPDYYFSVAELRSYVEEVPWPQFVTNDLAQVVAANRAAQALWEVTSRRSWRAARRPSSAS